MPENVLLHNDEAVLVAGTAAHYFSRPLEMELNGNTVPVTLGDFDLHIEFIGPSKQGF